MFEGLRHWRYRQAAMPFQKTKFPLSHCPHLRAEACSVTVWAKNPIRPIRRAILETTSTSPATTFTKPRMAVLSSAARLHLACKLHEQSTTLLDYGFTSYFDKHQTFPSDAVKYQSVLPSDRN